MKKIIIMSISLLAVAFTNAQIKIGIKGGFSMANQQFEPNEDANQAQADNLNKEKKALAGFHGGVTVDFPVSEKFVIEPALLFSKKGSVTLRPTIINNLITKAPFQVTLNYLEMPINFLYRQSSTGGFYGGGGPYIAYAVSGNTVINNSGIKNNIVFDEDKTKRFDAGANFVLGYELPIGVTISTNYSLGLTSITNPKDGIKTKNNYLGVSLGYKFKN